MAGSNSNTSDDDKNRRKEFENSLGNLLVAEYQCHRLRERIKNHFSTGDSVLESSFMFKVDDRWYRINVSAEKQPEEEKEAEEVQEPKKKKQKTHGFAMVVDDEEIPTP